MGAAGAPAFDNERWSPTAADGTVEVAAFYLARHEVTVRQFGVFAAATGWIGDGQALTSPGDHPVTHVSWTDALAYCRWLEATLKTSPTTPAVIAERLRARVAGHAAERGGMGEGGAWRRPPRVSVGRRTAPRSRQLRGQRHDTGGPLRLP